MAKVDMHCHSIYSDQPIHWFFRQLGAKESYTPPDELYRRLKSLGMNFVTITDHDRIDGALELAEKYTDSFISCEFGVNFYREEASLHLCAYDISEKQFSMGLKLKHDIQEFAGYFREQDVLVSVPHPFHCNRGKLNIGHLEQALLLFDYFEEMNGLQMESANRMQKDFFDNLTPEFIDALQKKHNIQPVSKEPWKKGRLGGSDDHSSFFLGRCWSEVEEAGDYKQFLQGICEKRSRGFGQSMTALAFSQATQSNWINAILDQHCKPGPFDERLLKLVSKVRPESKTRKIVNGLIFNNKTGIGVDNRSSFFKKIIAKRVIRFRLMLFLYTQKRFLDKQLQDDCECLGMDVPVGSAMELDSCKSTIQGLIADWRDSDLLFNCNPGRNLQEETFVFISSSFNRLYRYSFQQWLYHIQTGNIPEAFAKLSLIIPGILPAIPYIMGYKHLYYDNKYLQEIGKTYQLKNSPNEQPEKWAWFTDTPLGENGSAQIIRQYTEMAEKSVVSITIIGSHPDDPLFKGNYINFKPLFHFTLPEYESISFSLPPILDILHHCEQQGYTRLIISSPGPVGLLGLWIADILSIPASGVYHDDIPGYVRRLTNDPGMEQGACHLIRFFYEKMERVYTLTESSRHKLIAEGISKDKIRLFMRGTDISFFKPEQRNVNILKKWGIDNKVVLLYVGNVSRENDLEVLKESYQKIHKSMNNIALVIVGEGSYLIEFRQEMVENPDVIFTGFITGDELAEIYGSCDIFVFPETTDIYGTTLLEAQSSGLPAVVSDAGGSQEVICAGETGLIAQAGDVESFTRAIVRLLEDPELRQLMGKRSRVRAEKQSWQRAFDYFVEDHRKKL
jgi:glycosyltransferase involved in cell wall biosynthesis/predicted metal-dependent phosphoesterase TrpH